MKIRKTNGFTLIELLVVISIIALLVSILMPALAKAKKQAQNVICQSNTKQIGMITALFQTENDDKVPPILNMWAGTDSAGNDIPMRAKYLSLALMDFWDGEVKLPATMNPEARWPNAVRDEYMLNYLPEYFLCPFIRGKEVGYDMTSTQAEMFGVSDVRLQTAKGYFESYTVSRWEHPRNWSYLDNEHPLGAPNGMLKYGVLSWNSWNRQRSGNSSDPQYYNKPVQWGKSDFKRVKASGPSDAIILFCDRGESMGYNSGALGIYNYGSHEKGGRGGTFANFADNHVEWVEGSQIGWR